MIISNDVEIPDKCPVNCPGIKKYLILCPQCPVFNCMPDVDGEVFCRPEGYRHDWALAW